MVKITSDFWLTPRGTIGCRQPSALLGKTPAEAVVMVETRKLLRAMPADRTSEELQTAVKAAFRNLARRTAPFLPLHDEQRLGWLDEHSHLACRIDMDDSFACGVHYKIQCHDIPTRRLIERATISGGKEEVLICGTELRVTLRDNHQRLHTFCHEELATDPRIHACHPLLVLQEHFLIPDTPDITKILPSKFSKTKKALAAL